MLSGPGATRSPDHGEERPLISITINPFGDLVGAAVAAGTC